VYAQHGAYDTIKVMSYNIANYGFTSHGCPTLVTSVKNPWLRSILAYESPDIIGFEKFNISPASISTDTIVHKVLDSVCAGCYKPCGFTNVSGYTKANMLYYKASKLGFVSTTTIYSADNNISDINLHRLYYKSPTLSLTHDTIFINVILLHLASGSGSTTNRASEISGAMSWLNSHVTTGGNYILMGDMNTQNSTESCFQQLINSANSNTKFYDPPNQLGDWSGNPTHFSMYLTQSTRTSDPGDCAATGGVNNRFDHILCTKYLMDGTDSLMYVPQSYRVVGQDGLHTNGDINGSPTNTSVPSNILNALYNMSEHLPVVLQLAVGAHNNSTGISETTTQTWTFDHLVSSHLIIRPLIDMTGSLYHIRIIDMQGRSVRNIDLRRDEVNDISLEDLTAGTYQLWISDGETHELRGRFVKTEP
jgi:hypothetical protein